MTTVFVCSIGFRNVKQLTLDAPTHRSSTFLLLSLYTSITSRTCACAAVVKLIHKNSTRAMRGALRYAPVLLWRDGCGNGFEPTTITDANIRPASSHGQQHQRGQLADDGAVVCPTYVVFPFFSSLALE